MALFLLGKRFACRIDAHENVRNVANFTIYFDHWNLVTDDRLLFSLTPKESPFNPVDRNSPGNLSSRRNFSTHGAHEHENRFESLFPVNYVKNKATLLLAFVQENGRELIIPENTVDHLRAVTLRPH